MLKPLLVIPVWRLSIIENFENALLLNNGGILLHISLRVGGRK
jgi:hypothetical protein